MKEALSDMWPMIYEQVNPLTLQVELSIRIPETTLIATNSFFHSSWFFADLVYVSSYFLIWWQMQLKLLLY